MEYREGRSNQSMLTTDWGRKQAVGIGVRDVKSGFSGVVAAAQSVMLTHIKHRVVVPPLPTPLPALPTPRTFPLAVVLPLLIHVQQREVIPLDRTS